MWRTEVAAAADSLASRHSQVVMLKQYVAEICRRVPELPLLALVDWSKREGLKHGMASAALTKWASQIWVGQWACLARCTRKGVHGDQEMSIVQNDESFCKLAGLSAYQPLNAAVSFPRTVADLGARAVAAFAFAFAVAVAVVASDLEVSDYAA